MHLYDNKFLIFPRTIWIPWLLMPWLLVSPGHQHPCYWLYMIGNSVAFMGKDFNYISIWKYYIDGLVQERCNSTARLQWIPRISYCVMHSYQLSQSKQIVVSASRPIRLNFTPLLSIFPGNDATNFTGQAVPEEELARNNAKRDHVLWYIILHGCNSVLFFM